MVDERHLVYFKELLEGNSEISFRAYLSNNEDSLRKQFSPARFARLKFKSIDEIIKILDEEKISYIINDQAIRNENYLAQFSGVDDIVLRAKEAVIKQQSSKGKVGRDIFL
ncbi:hypothetical protein [Paenibacillus agaridevorans]|uniref:hypothetical protein n=1 Tax=Paenibacillus agaridevorans TaxID=171404 RepID=UPI001BE41127|nr:hypothetical protein [Paenibacillus agaridevorans]